MSGPPGDWVTSASMPLPDTITVDADLNGPVGSANGGVAAGLVGSLVGGPARVRIYRPPPLGRAMRLLQRDGELDAKLDGEIVMSGAASVLDVHPPTVTRAEATAATAPFVGHTAVTCVVCGPRHKRGLKLAPGPVGAGPVHATVWIPPAWTADDEGVVRPEIVWGVLDCPGAIMLLRHYPDETMFPALGTIVAEVSRPIRAGREYVVVAWPRGRDGRKLYAGTALVDSHGDTVARSDQVCIVMPYGWAGIA